MTEENTEQQNAPSQGEEAVVTTNEAVVETTAEEKAPDANTEEANKEENTEESNKEETTEEDLNSMSYNELKKLAKQLGVPAKGGRNELVKAILNASEETEDEEDEDVDSDDEDTDVSADEEDTDDESDDEEEDDEGGLDPDNGFESETLKEVVDQQKNALRNQLSNQANKSLNATNSALVSIDNKY